MSSLVEVERNALPAIEVPSPEQGSDRRESNLLHLAWQSRWLILLCMVIGAGCGWAILQKVTPLYTSVSRIYVERNLPQILSQQMQVGESASYLFTQAELIRSSNVLAEAAKSPQFAELERFRDVDNPVGFLKQCIRATVGNQDDIINVSAELPNGKDAGQIVNAVVDAYVTKYAEKRENDTAAVLTILQNERDKRETELKESRD